MSDELATITPGDNAMVVPVINNPLVDQDVEKDLAKGGKFLPRIQIASASSGIVKEDKIGPGRLAMVSGKEVTDLGKQAIGLIIAWRPKALRYQDGTAVDSYDTKSDLYKEIRAAANEGGANNPNQYGPEFLVWLVEHQQLVYFFHGSLSQRNEGTLGISVFNEQQVEKKWIPVRWDMDLAKSKKFSWHVARLKKHDQEVPVELYPAPAVYADQVNRFLNPKKKDTGEKAEEAANDRG